MPLTTAIDLISLVLQDCGAFGIGQSPNAKQVNDALARLNMMLGQWQKKRGLVYTQETLGITSTGAQTYTVGPTGDFAFGHRPGRISSGYVRMVTSGAQPVDYPLTQLNSLEDYNRLALKTLSTLPTHFYYDDAYPLAKVYFWPVPIANIYSLYLSALGSVLSEVPTLTTEIELPGEYYAAIYYNMIVRHYPVFRIPPDPVIVQLAKESLEVIRKANVQVSTLNMPGALTRGGAYNVYSDRGR